MDRLPTSPWHHNCTGVSRHQETSHCTSAQPDSGPRDAAGSRRGRHTGRQLLHVTVLTFCLLPTLAGRASQGPWHVPLNRPPAPLSSVFRAVSRCRPQLHARERWHIAGVIHQESQRYGYDPLFVVAMAQVESACSPRARSEDGALGLIQVKPSTARLVARGAGVRWRGAHMLAKPAINVRLGLRYLRQLERQFRDPYVAIAAYNLGPERVAGMPGHRARRTHYVRKVLSHYELLLARHHHGRL